MLDERCQSTSEKVEVVVVIVVAVSSSGRSIREGTDDGKERHQALSRKKRWPTIVFEGWTWRVEGHVMRRKGGARAAGGLYRC